jgi:hypothetical protein
MQTITASHCQAGNRPAGQAPHLGGAHREADVGLHQLPQVLRRVVIEPSAVEAVAGPQVRRLIQALVAAEAGREARELAKKVLANGLREQGGRPSAHATFAAAPRWHVWNNTVCKLWYPAVQPNWYLHGATSTCMAPATSKVACWRQLLGVSKW